MERKLFCSIAIQGVATSLSSLSGDSSLTFTVIAQIILLCNTATSGLGMEQLTVGTGLWVPFKSTSAFFYTCKNNLVLELIYSDSIALYVYMYIYPPMQIYMYNYFLSH